MGLKKLEQTVNNLTTYVRSWYRVYTLLSRSAGHNRSFTFSMPRCKHVNNLHWCWASLQTASGCTCFFSMSHSLHMISAKISVKIKTCASLGHHCVGICTERCYVTQLLQCKMRTARIRCFSAVSKLFPLALSLICLNVRCFGNCCTRTKTKAHKNCICAFICLHLRTYGKWHVTSVWALRLKRARGTFISSQSVKKEKKNKNRIW